MRKQVFRIRRAGGLAALLVLAGGPLVGCGIQQTDVIEAGRPVVADLLPPREGRVLLFFFSPDEELLPVPRIVEEPWQKASAGAAGSAATDEGTGESSPLAAVTALLAGPDKAERRAGLRNAPTLPRAATAADRVVVDGSTVEVELRLPVTRLAAPARDQLVCTAAYAAHTKGAVSVSLVGQDGRLAPADCPVRPAPAPAR
ncbi:hypothetical protein [Streptomyces sp. SID14515]|uniref:hypothetical protein n=1 Tax=Streptomyces sp. SID14515 TaxID=2706074 RepID=UPI0013CBF77B|nr:hypothetical protein [Streptomyces sp. SID14515]NEB37743.1 hypothetical protein [Streptomyces sp. SID14515]